MPGREPRIVGDEMVSGPHRLGRIAAEKMPHALGHRVHMPRRAGDRLGDHPALQVENTSGEIAGLPHRGAEGGADHGLRLLFHHGNETAPHQLVVNLGKSLACRHYSPPCIRTTLPQPSMLACQPGQSKTEVSSSTIIRPPEPRAGPKSPAFVDGPFL